MDIVEQRAQKELLRKLQEVDFVLTELNLYLNTPPNDADAFNQFNYYVGKREQIKCKYEELYGPLMNFGHSYNRHPNSWSKGPWPWEL